MLTENHLRKLCRRSVSFLNKEHYNIIKDIPLKGIRHLFDAPSSEYSENTLSEKILTLQILKDLAKCTFYDLITAYVVSQQNYTFSRISGASYFLTDCVQQKIDYPINQEIKHFILNCEWEKWIVLLKPGIYDNFVLNYYLLTLEFFLKNEQLP